eukprot:SAG31_NODE_3131_length_4641_cov_1.488771_3_plen_267_part_00
MWTLLRGRFSHRVVSTPPAAAVAIGGFVAGMFHAADDGRGGAGASRTAHSAAQSSWIPSWVYGCSGAAVGCYLASSMGQRRDRYQWISEEEVSTVARLINYCIDLDYFNEDEEQTIFEHAVAASVDAIANVLPEPFAELVIRTQSNHGRIGIDAAMAHDISTRLMKHVRAKVPLPYLDKDDEKMLLQCVVALVVEAMRHDHRIKDVCKPENAAEIIVSDPITVRWRGMQTRLKIEAVCLYMLSALTTIAVGKRFHEGSNRRPIRRR